MSEIKALYSNEEPNESEIYQVRDEDRLRGNFTMIPNMIHFIELSPYARCLYIYLKHVAGEEGACWQSARALSEMCEMSTGKITEAKRELQRRGLIKIRVGKNKYGGKGRHYITINDVWDENDKICRNKKATKTNFTIHEIVCSHGEHASAPCEHASAPDESVNNISLNKTPVSILKTQCVPLQPLPSAIIIAYESCIGKVTKGIAKKLQEFNSKYPQERIIYAIQEACARGKPRIGYIEGILINIEKDGGVMGKQSKETPRPYPLPDNM